ncbi:MAG TPA: S46 family peptidase [bacterium]|nr:S46 family peptidase [bacterium]HPG84280.1 S46 family peptidase [bacterium]HPM60142.1 S46 family peptidase [bacterium]
MNRIIRTTLAMVLLLSAALATADEGMWTFDNPPTKQLQEKYNFTPTKEWLDHVRLSSVRFMDGGSGSFVSPNGLVMTNHHVAMGQLQKMSTAEQNFVATGFYAPTPEQEAKCPDLELNVLVDMVNVTSRITGAVKPGMKPADALKARKEEQARIEKEYSDKTGLRCDVVSLYNGGEYWLYQYKRYTDIRLVMAPERQIAFWGGDDDNFTYPRYDLDMAFFRVYVDDQPLSTPDYLKFNAAGAENNELVFVSGHPGSTSRLDTYTMMEMQRDYSYPMTLEMIQKRLDVLRSYSKKGPEQERRALGQIFGLENSKKALGGQYQGLLDAKLMAKAKADEEAFRARVNANPEWKKAYGDGWKTIEKVIAKQKKEFGSRSYGSLALSSSFARYAQTLVFAAAERKKPDMERLDGYHDVQLERAKLRLFSPAPIYKDLEEATFTSMLQMAVDKAGTADPIVSAVLKGRSAEKAAQEMIAATTLDKPDVRKALFEGGAEAVAQSTDPFIVVIRELEPMLRERQEKSRKETESLLTPASEKIANARFAVYGKNMYPDATFTLRLSYGAVKGYPMNGTKAPYKTTLYGLYDRALGFDQEGAWALPPRFWDRQKDLDLSTPANFVCTADIIGGNSGSPVINRNAELVGLVFDGNIESLVGDSVYDENANRCVAVHSAFIIEGLRKLYDAGKLADEIEGK